MTTQVPTDVNQVLAGWTTKTCYHSRLSAATRPDGLVVRFTSPVRQSTFKEKSGQPKPDYINFKVYGDAQDREFTYQTETPAIAAYLRDTLQGVAEDEWVIITAEGSRDAATVEISFVADPPAEDAPEVPPDQPSDLAAPLPFEQGSVAQQAAQANQERAEASTGGQTGSGMGNSYLAALLASAAAIEGFRQEMGRDPTDDERASATAIFIQMNR